MRNDTLECREAKEGDMRVLVAVLADDALGQGQHAKERGCSRVQLTSNKQRPEAHPFYEGLGSKAKHEGFKLSLG